MRVIYNRRRYENYWKITLEYSDFCGKPFNIVLKYIIDYIDKYKKINSKEYNELQKDITKLFPKADRASTRKSINQMFKLGFIYNGASQYHYLSKSFLAEKDKERKRLLYSKIIYDNASFNRSFTHDSNTNEIKFLVKTIEACCKINKEQLLAIMFCDINKYERGYLTPQELNIKVKEIRDNQLAERKYNQRNYLFNLCSNLTDIYTSKNVITLNPNLIIDEEEKVSSGRDSYLQRLYKIELINEEKDLYKDEKGKCVLEHRAYPILIASHIKPYRLCEQNEQFDRNNGLLLSKNMDSLFDKGYITFDDRGNVITSSKLDSEVEKYVKTFRLDAIIYNDKRRNYMKYHREHIFLK